MNEVIEKKIHTHLSDHYGISLELCYKDDPDIVCIDIKESNDKNNINTETKGLIKIIYKINNLITNIL